MPLAVSIGAMVVFSLLSLLFSTLTYSLRDYSRTRLAEFLGRHNKDKWFEPVIDHTSDLIYLTAISRQLCNVLIWVGTFATFETISRSPWSRYGLSILAAVAIAVIVSVTIPHAVSKYAASELIGFFSPLLSALHKAFSPIAKLMHSTDNVMRRALGAENEEPAEQIEQDIMSAVEEGESQGVVDEQEREMIESVIELRDTTAAQIMTARSNLVAIPAAASLIEVKQLVEESSHSRVPVYDPTLDHVVGILYARDLIRHLGQTTEPFELRKVMRRAYFVPETKTVRDLLADFRLQKIHIAIVLDEYGGTAGIVTIEDILEELVGEIADEHESDEPAMLRRIDDRQMEVDALIRIEELNRLAGLTLPEDAGYDTLGGFVSTVLSRIPEKGATFEQHGARFTILESEPQRVKRVRIELLSPAPA